MSDAKLISLMSLDAILLFVWVSLSVLGVLFIASPTIGPIVGYTLTIALLGLTLWRYSTHFKVTLILYPFLYLLACIVHYMTTRKLAFIMLIDATFLAFAFFIISPGLLYLKGLVWKPKTVVKRRLPPLVRS